MKIAEKAHQLCTQEDDKKGLIIALSLHVILLLIIIATVFFKPEAALGPIQLELWTEGQEQIVQAPAQSRSPDPADENVEAETPQPKPVTPPSPVPATKAQPAPAPAAAPKMQTESPDIALQEKKKKAEEAKQKALEEAKVKKAKEEAEKKAKALAKAKAEQEAKELAKKKAEAEAKAKAKALAEAKAKAEDEAKAKAKAQAKAIAERKAKEAKLKAEQAGASLRAAMRGDINSIAGIPNGKDERNQLGGGGGSSAYIRAVQACVQPHLVFSGGVRLVAKYRVQLDAQRHPQKADITRRSGNPAFDRAVQHALMQCNPYPKPPTPMTTISGDYIYSPQ